MIKTMTPKDLRRIVAQIKIHRRGTKDGEAQREAFRIRWGKRPEEL